jgi:hypothetical protein
MLCYVLVIDVDRMERREGGKVTGREGVKKGKKCGWKEGGTENEDIRVK